MTKPHNCAHHGHVWREGQRPDRPQDYPQRPLYARHRNREAGPVDVFCQHCTDTNALEAYAKNTAPPITNNGPSR